MSTPPLSGQGPLPDQGPLLDQGNLRVRPCRYGPMAYLKTDRYVGRSLDLYGEFCEGEAAFFGSIVKTGMTVVDAGANIGAHSVLFARLAGPGGAVFAYEPQRKLHRLLCANLALNEADCVRALHAGAGREAGRAFVPWVDYGRPNNFGGMYLKSGPDAETPTGEDVDIIPVDGLELPACHFIKIDTEGMERDVILGARRTIERHRPVLFVENNLADGSADLIGTIMALDYRAYWFCVPYYNPKNLYGNPVDVFGGQIAINMLCMPRSMNMTILGLKEILGPTDRP